jgi:hypothetical protein
MVYYRKEFLKQEVEREHGSAITKTGSGTKKQDIVDFEGQSVLKKRSLSW